MVVDGDVTLRAPVEDPGKVIVINVLSGSGEAAGPGRVKDKVNYFFREQRAISSNRWPVSNEPVFFLNEKITQINVISLFFNKTKRRLFCGKRSSWFVVLQVRAAFKQANQPPVFQKNPFPLVSQIQFWLCHFNRTVLQLT